MMQESDGRWTFSSVSRVPLGRTWTSGSCWTLFKYEWTGEKALQCTFRVHAVPLEVIFTLFFAPTQTVLPFIYGTSALKTSFRLSPPLSDWTDNFHLDIVCNDNVTKLCLGRFPKKTKTISTKVVTLENTTCVLLLPLVVNAWVRKTKTKPKFKTLYHAPLIR
jgi:hypothetical protein